MRVTVLDDPKTVPGMVAHRGVRSVTIKDALAARWQTDAHFTAYEPIELRVNGGDATTLVRARMHGAVNDDRTVYNVDGARMTMRLLVGDVDDVDAHRSGAEASDEWRADFEERVADADLLWYHTRGGARVLAPLREPFEITAPEHAAEWRARYLAWASDVWEAHGIELDTTCADPTRVFRLPATDRYQGTPHGSWCAVSLPEAREGARREEACLPSAPRLDPEAPQRAMLGGILGAIGDWEDYAGRKHALVGAIAGYLRKVGARADDCEWLIRTWLADAPASVDVDAGVRWARKTWERDPEEVSGAVALEAIVGADIAGAIYASTGIAKHARRAESALAAPVESGWAFESFTAPEEPIGYVVPGLCLAPSKGKISLIAGLAGAGKGPLAGHIAACIALGEPVLGTHDVTPARVLLLDFEGVRLTMRRLRRIVASIGREVTELDGRLLVYDASHVCDTTEEVWLDELTAVVRANDVGVIVVDSYTTAMLGSGVDYNSPEFALLARALGQLDRLVICVAHASKANRDGQPRLADIAGSSALGALAQTAIVLSYPDADDRYRVRVGCARAPERRFEAFDLQWTDGDAGELHATIVEATSPAAPVASTKRETHNAARGAGERIVRRLRVDGVATRTELRAVGGEGSAAADRALALLSDAGLVSSVAGHYELTPTGAAAGAATVASALGSVAGYTRK